MNAPSRLKLRAVIGGCAVDIGCSVAAMTALSALYTVRYAECAMAPEELAEHVGRAVENSMWGFVACCFCTVVGGFVSGWLAKSDRLRHAFWTGMLGLMFSLPMVIGSGHGVTPLGAISLLLLVPLALSGGFLSDALLDDDAG